MKTIVKSNQHFEFAVDSEINRLYIKCVGFWKEEEIVDDYIATQTKSLQMLKPSFSLLVDMRDFKAVPAEFVPKREDTMVELAQAGLANVAEVVSVSVISKLQLSKSTAATNTDTNKFSTSKEAEKWLNNLNAN